MKQPLKLRQSLVWLLLALLFVTPVAAAEEESEEESFDFNEMIFHHVTDSHEWEFFHGATLPLPVILYDQTAGELVVFMSSQLHQGAHKGFKYDEEHHLVHTAGHEFLDFSITKNVFAALISMVLMLWVFFSVAQGTKKRQGQAPKGIQSFFEPVIIFVRDDIAREVIGQKHFKRYLPFLLTVFFFILFNNLLGLLPGAANVTGNIAITLTLAVFTFLITNFTAKKDYWLHIVNTPGVPWWLKFPVPLIPFIEFIGLFTKPFSLTVRLFANITAGHILILSILGLTFLFESYAVGVASALFGAVMLCLEVLVAMIQAYVFTLLSAIYFGQAVEEHAEH